jgi:hypothetical protein
MSVDSRAVDAVGGDQLLYAGSTDVVLAEKRNLVPSEPPLPLSGRLTAVVALEQPRATAQQ